MHLRLIPVTPRMVERLKAAQIAMFGDPSHGGRLHEEVVQTARGPEHRWVAGEAAPKPKPKKPATLKTPEKGKDPNDKRTFELDDLINIHRKAQVIPRHHVYQAALQAWNHDPEARERYKEAMVEDTSAGEGPAHQRLRLWYAKGRLRETMKGLDEATFFEAVEALKAKARGDTATLDMLALMGPPAAPAAKRDAVPPPASAAVSHAAPQEPTHGGHLHAEMRTDKIGRTQTRWVGQPEATAAHQEPAAPKPAPTPKANATKAAGGQAEVKKKPASDWPTEHPGRNDVDAVQKWLTAAPPGARLQIGDVALEKRDVDLPQVGGIWRLSGLRDVISSEALAIQLGPELAPDDEGNAREWERYFRKPTPKQLEGKITAAAPGEDHIHIDDPVIQTEIPSAYVGRFEAAVERLQKRAARLGLQPLTFEKTGTSAQTVVVGQPPDIITRIVPTTLFTVVMPDMALPGGWKFIGAVEHGENGNKVHFRHKPDSLDTKAYRLHESTCDHCQTNRRRKLTVVLQNRDGETKRVGSDCMKDYIGHDIPLTGWSSIQDQMQAELYGEIDEAWSEGAVKNATGATTEDYMATVARVIREDGRYISRRGADDGETPTADAAWSAITNRKGDPANAGAGKRALAEEDLAAAARVIAWARAIPPDTDDDFLHNVRVALAGPAIIRSDAGFAAAAFAAMRRDNAKRGIVEPGTGRRVGNVGDKIGIGKGYAIPPIVGTVIHRSDHRSDFGWSSLVKVKGDDGNVYTTFASNPNYTNMGQHDPYFLTSYGLLPKRTSSGPAEGTPDAGDRVRIHGGSIKKHETFRGEPQNVLTRTKFERIGIPDISEAKLPTKREKALDGRGVEVEVENPWREHEIAFMDHASAEAQRQGHMPGDDDFAHAFAHELKAAKARWPQDFGAHHYVDEWNDDGLFWPRTHNDRITDTPRTEIGLLNHLRAQQRRAREYGQDWHWPDADTYQAMLDETLKRGREYPSQHEITKALAPEVGPPPVRNRQAHPFVGTIRIPGLPKIRVETKKGETRSGVDPDGNAWSVVMPAHYGEFHGTRGVDGDPVDVFVGPDVHAPYAYVFHMSKLGEGGYDEDKVACGFKTREDAERCLRDAYDRAGLFHAPPKRLAIAELAHWLADPENKGRMVDAGREMAKGGPFIGPHGGKWADPQHTVAWKEHGVAHRALLAQAAAHSLGLCSVTVGHSTRSGKIAGLRASAAAADLVASGHLVRVSHASERETIGRGAAARQHTYSTTVYRLTDAGRAAAGEATKAVPVPVLSLTGAPPRVARVQVATAAPAAGQGLAEAIRGGEDVHGDGQGQGARVAPTCEACNVPMVAFRGPPWASVYGCPSCHAQARIPNPNYQRPEAIDAPAQAPEVCKDANCRNPAHGHPPEAAKSLPAHLEID